jgi:arylsulfatase A-like enzyme
VTRALRRLAGLALAVAACSPPTPAPQLTRLLEGDRVATIGRETRLALVMDTSQPARRRFALTPPASGVLELGYGIPNASLAAGAGPATFQLTLEDGGARRELLRRRLDPSQRRDRRWFDVRVDLAEFAGRPIGLELAATPEAGGRPAPLAAWSDPVVYAAGAAPEHPNLLLISIDTLRARDVGAYGYPRDTTPFLDEFARRGVLFENAITASVTTGPSHMSLFTGLYPVNHGLRTGLDWKLPGATTAAARLRAAGYQTAAFTEDGYIVRERGFGQGFSEYTENPGSERRGPGDARVTFRQAERWLGRNARLPFFLFVHTYQVHSPYTPPPRYAKLFEGDGLPGPEDPVLHRARDDYDREIRYVDDLLRELLGRLHDSAAGDSTIVAIVSDHGEEFGEHGHFQHGGDVYEEVLRVPFVIVGPGVPAGRRVTDLVSLVDAMPTLLDLAGVSPPRDLDGTSLVATLRDGTPLPERTLFAEARARRRWIRPKVGETWNPPLVAVRSPGTKFIVHRPEHGEAGPPLRFDLKSDALERSPQTVKGAERTALDALVDDYLGGRVAPGALRPPDAPESLDPKLRERLRLLGYLE